MEKERIQRLVELRDVLESAIVSCESKRDLAALSKQYRETIKEIEEIKKSTPNREDKIGAVLNDRKIKGKPKANRKTVS